MADRGVHFRHGPSLACGALVGAGEIRGKVHVCRDRTLDDWAAVYLVAGGGWFADEATPRCPVAAGDLLLLAPGIRHSYVPEVPGDWSEYWMTFTGETFAILRRAGILDPERPVLHPGVVPELVVAFDALVGARIAAAVRARSAEDARLEEAQLAAEAHLLLVRLVRSDGADDASGPPWVAEACARLAADLQRPLDLARLAARCGLSYERFRKAFAAAVGEPPARYRLRRRIDRAKTLLTAGATIAETAETLGFCDVYFFSRQFRAATGTTPARFRGRGSTTRVTRR